MTKTKQLSKQQLKDFADAVERAHQSAANWPEFWNAVCGVGGPLATLFPTQEQRILLIQTPQYKRFQELLAQRQGTGNEFLNQIESASGNIALRLPKSLHATLKVEAETEGVSLNQLIMAKLAVQLRAACSA